MPGPAARPMCMPSLDRRIQSLWVRRNIRKYPPFDNFSLLGFEQVWTPILNPMDGSLLQVTGYQRSFDPFLVIFSFKPICKMDKSWKLSSDESYLEMKIYPVMKVIIVKEVMTCDVLPVAIFFSWPGSDLQLRVSVGIKRSIRRRGSMANVNLQLSSEYF